MMVLTLLLCAGCASVKPAQPVPYGAEEKQTGIFTLSDEWADVLCFMGPVFYIVGEVLGSHN